MAKTNVSDTTESTTPIVVDTRELEAQRIIKKYAAIAVSAGFIPVPLLDLATLSGIQLKLIHEIGKLHGKTFNENVGKSVVTSALATLSANPAARIGSSLLKIVPVFGTMLGAVSFHGYAAASTYAIGNLFHNHFSNGGTILDFNASKAKGAYNNLVSSFKSTPAAETATATA